MKLWILLALFTTIISASEVIIMKQICKLNKIKSTDAIAFTIVISGIFSFIYLFTYSSIDFSNINIKFSVRNILIVLLGALLLLNRVFFINSIDLAPNPGYSHLIVNTNVILTFIIGFLLFNYKMNPYTICGSLITLLGISIVIYFSNK